MELRRRTACSLAPVAVAATLLLASCAGDDDDAERTTAPGAGTVVEVTAASTAPTGSASTTTRPADTEPATTTTAATEATTSGPPSPSPAEVAFTSPEGDYSAVFPSTPSSQTQPTPLPDGTTIDLVITGAEVGGVAFATARGRYPDGSVLDGPLALQVFEDQALANLAGTLIASRDIELQGRRGREFSASITSNGVAGTVLQRIYLDGVAVYQIIAAGEGPLAFEDPQPAAFFASFRFGTG